MNERHSRRVDVLRALWRGSGILAAHRWPREQLEHYRDQRLRALVAHTRSQSPFRAERLRNIDIAAPDLLRRLPTMDKPTMMRDLPRVLTDPGLRGLDLESHLEGLTDDALLLGRTGSWRAAEPAAGEVCSCTTVRGGPR